MINFGEVSTSSGIRSVQLKGIGMTPYSRFADGNAVLRSALREHLMSEFMHSLHVPTTRSLGVVSTKEKIKRDFCY